MNNEWSFISTPKYISAVCFFSFLYQDGVLLTLVVFCGVVLGLCQRPDYMAQNGKVIDETLISKDLEGNNCTLIEVAS
jgi:hypothetical protein